MEAVNAFFNSPVETNFLIQCSGLENHISDKGIQMKSKIFCLARKSSVCCHREEATSVVRNQMQFLVLGSDELVWWQSLFDPEQYVIVAFLKKIDCNERKKRAADMWGWVKTQRALAFSKLTVKAFNNGDSSFSLIVVRLLLRKNIQWLQFWRQRVFLMVLKSQCQVLLCRY